MSVLHRSLVAAVVGAVGSGFLPLSAQISDSAAVFVPTYPTTMTVQPGDVLHLRIWREPDLSGDFAVAADSSVVLPKLGRIHAAGISPNDLQRNVIQAYGVYLRNPWIDITISRRISVFGNVKRPGSYVVDPTETLADVITAAGGVTSTGDDHNLRLVRRDSVVRTGLKYDESLAEVGVGSGDQIVIGKRSLWSIGAKQIFSVAASALAILYLYKRVFPNKI